MKRWDGIQIFVIGAGIAEKKIIEIRIVFTRQFITSGDTIRGDQEIDNHEFQKTEPMHKNLMRS